jgi:hypothetical protein
MTRVRLRRREGGDRAVCRQYRLALIDHGGTAVLADLAAAVLQHHQNDVVVVDQGRGMPVVHWRQRPRRHGKARQHPQRQIDLDRKAAQRIDLDAENPAPERFTKRFDAVVPLQGVAHNAERRYFTVHRSPLLSFIDTIPAARTPTLPFARYNANAR